MARGAGPSEGHQHTTPTAMEEQAGSAHSPLPWHQGPHYRTDVISPGGLVAEVGRINTPRGIADAELICRAVNCHDELLAALKAITREFDLAIVRGQLSPGTYNSEIATSATKAILKAEGR